MSAIVTIVEGATLAEAKQKVSETIPAGATAVTQKILCDGLTTSEFIAETGELAYRQAESHLPPGAVIANCNELSPADRQTLTILADDETSATGQAAAKALAWSKEFGHLKAVRLIKPANKGFMGIGKSVGQYEADLVKWCKVKITYQAPARIEVSWGEPVVWGTEPPHLIVAIMDMEPSGGRQQFANRLTAAMPTDRMPKNLSLIVRRGYASARDEQLVRETVIRAAQHHHFRPNLDRLLIQDLPPIDGPTGVMVAVYPCQVDYLKETWQQFGLNDGLLQLFKGEPVDQRNYALKLIEAGGDEAIWGHVWQAVFETNTRMMLGEDFEDEDATDRREAAIKAAGESAVLPIALVTLSPGEFAEFGDWSKLTNSQSVRSTVEAIITARPEWGEAWKALAIWYLDQRAFLPALISLEYAQYVGLKNSGVDGWIQDLKYPNYEQYLRGADGLRNEFGAADNAALKCRLLQRYAPR